MGTARAERIREQLGYVAWMDKSKCTYKDRDLFFPASGESVTPAKTICTMCPVRNECLDYAIGNNIHHGVWGGLSDRERRKLKRNRNKNKQNK